MPSNNIKISGVILVTLLPTIKVLPNAASQEIVLAGGYKLVFRGEPVTPKGTVRGGTETF